MRHENNSVFLSPELSNLVEKPAVEKKKKRKMGKKNHMTFSAGG